MFMNMNTVEENKQIFTNRQLLEAEKARKLLHMIGFSSIAEYKNIISNNILKECPVTIGAINNAKKIFGPDLYSIQGKTIRKKPKK